MNWAIAGAGAAVLGMVWALVCVLRGGRTRDLQAQRSVARKILTRFARNALEHPNLDAIVAESARTALRVR